MKHTQGIKNRTERMPENEAAPAPRVSQASPSSPQPFFSRVSRGNVALRAGAVPWGIAPSRGRFPHDSCARGGPGSLVQWMRARGPRGERSEAPGSQRAPRAVLKLPMPFLPLTPGPRCPANSAAPASLASRRKRLFYFSFSLVTEFNFISVKLFKKWTNTK